MTYSKENKEKIVDNLLQGTKSGYIKWTLSDNLFNSDTRHLMEYTSNDGLTKFELEIELEKDMSNLTKGRKSLYIENTDLIDGNLRIPSREYEHVKTLAELIYEKFVKPVVIKNPPKTGVLDSILSNINVQHMRQEKIDDILEDDDIKSIEKEAEELVKKRIQEVKAAKSLPKARYKESVVETEVKESEPESEAKEEVQPIRKKWLGIF